jgi:hypothetical protein
MASKKKVTKKGARGAGKAVEPRTEKELAIDNEEVRGCIVDHCTLIASKGAARKKINADITASRNALVARGMNRAALTVVEKCAKMEPQHAEGFALTLLLGLKAIGQPLQGDMFNEPPQPEQEAPDPPGKLSQVVPDAPLAHH